MYRTKDRRLGHFQVSLDMLDEVEVLRLLFAKLQFVPLGVDAILYRDVLDYYGDSPLFRPVKQGECVPQYTITISKQYCNENSELIYTFDLKEIK